jgi:DNA-damage-inducible protein J
MTHGITGPPAIEKIAHCARAQESETVPAAPASEIQCISERFIMSTTMVHVRVDEKTKQRAARTLAEMGISVSDAVRMLLVRVAAEKALPFDVRVPNATTVKALRAAEKRKGKRLTSAEALFKDLGI